MLRTTPDAVNGRRVVASAVLLDARVGVDAAVLGAGYLAVSSWLEREPQRASAVSAGAGI